ncbi:hypothetical protein SASPL_133407 [Salvia splendens]|uniref:Uncharacterized protein n=1 Tax=Salvia splendens TaxID=180675 RepID=A0A8X8X511_SALSN|nr:hypothetical protein SASPL_133407 [Salvia splendens]
MATSAPNSNEWKCQGRKKGKAGDRSSNNSLGEGAVETIWEGPDIMGEPHEGSEMHSGTYDMRVKLGDGNQREPPYLHFETPTPMHEHSEAGRGGPNEKRVAYPKSCPNHLTPNADGLPHLWVRWICGRPNVGHGPARKGLTGEGGQGHDACVPLTETGRVRKKIVFEFDELFAGTNGGGSAIAGKDGWSSLPGEREKGRWKRKARPGPFEACTGAFEVVPGVLPLLAGELRFSMGKKDGSARHQPEVVTGTRLDGALPEVNEAVAQGVLRSTRVEAAASAAVLDEDTSSERNGANMLFDPPTLAAPFPEKDRHVLASETCDSLMGQSILQFKSGDGTNFKAEDNNGGGEVGLNGTPSAPDNPSDPPDELLDQDRDQPEILPKHSASEVGIDVASPVGSPPTLGHSQEFITDKAAQAETQPVEPDLDEKPANTGAGLDSGGPPKSDAVNLDADHDTEMGTFGWCEGIPSLTFSNEETKCLVDKSHPRDAQLGVRTKWGNQPLQSAGTSINPPLAEVNLSMAMANHCEAEGEGVSSRASTQPTAMDIPKQTAAPWGPNIGTQQGGGGRAALGPPRQAEVDGGPL